MRAKRLVLAQLETAFPQSGAQPVDDRQQLRRRALRSQADQMRTPPELDVLKMQHKLATECQLLRRLCRFLHARATFLGNCAEKNSGDMQIASRDRATERGVRLRLGGQLRTDRIRRPEREEQAAILHMRSSSPSARATV